MLKKFISSVGLGSGESTTSSEAANLGNFSRKFSSSTLAADSAATKDPAAAEFIPIPQHSISYLLQVESASGGGLEVPTEDESDLYTNPVFIGLSLLGSPAVNQLLAKLRTSQEKYRHLRKLYNETLNRRSLQQQNLSAIGYKWIGERDKLNQEITARTQEIDRLSEELKELRTINQELSEERDLSNRTLQTQGQEQCNLCKGLRTKLLESEISKRNLEIQLLDERNRNQQLQIELEELQAALNSEENRNASSSEAQRDTCGIQDFNSPLNPVTFSLSTFTFIKRLLSSSSLSAIRVEIGRASCRERV